MKSAIRSLPEKGISSPELIIEMQGIKSKDASWEEGRIFGYVFHPGEKGVATAKEK
jgi:hypothetical protein